eukprot:TRINITY_DN5969_c0_g1_i1.p1 TRINITY_DN5969_c0_g1~~TRINITY_DN5969_c0_g1_i1.p1  ORF type:complete len:166 (+),score=13.60 TRINITY_DN5969_c0_g1_i1:66-500(+)
MNVPLECEVYVENCNAQRKVTRFTKQIVELSHDKYNRLSLYIPPRSRKPHTFLVGMSYFIFVHSFPQLENNIVGIFHSRMDEGKVTLHLKLPTVFIYIREAQPSSLDLFVSVLLQYQNDPFGFNLEDFINHSQAKTLNNRFGDS